MDLWKLANEKRAIHQFSTLFTAKQVARDFAKREEIERAIDWCRKTAVTHVYVESYRDGVSVESSTLLAAKQRFLEAGMGVSGCVTPTKVGAPSTRWKELISCYTDEATQRRVGDIFRAAAECFDEVMIDDFWFTDCACASCNTQREAQRVRVAGKDYSVSTRTWDAYRTELMLQVSREYVLGAARRANPNAKLIIKYPQWYDRFHLRGYDVLRETAEFDRTWAGTETRDFPGPFQGNMPQYEAYFMMRWVLGLNMAKCGGGWYDPYGTTEHTYIEQARQTILGGARESLLFCYGSLLRDTGPRNIEVLRQHIPELFEVAEQVAQRTPVGVAALKPGNSHPLGEAFLFDYVGMLGVPLAPCHELPPDASALLVSTHALKDPDLEHKLSAFIAKERPVLVTDGLAARLSLEVDLEQHHVHKLAVAGHPAKLLELTEDEVDALRKPLLAALGHELSCPPRVAFYPFADGSFVLESFRDEPVRACLDGEVLELAPRSWLCRFR
jgi:hypothetical protein